MLKGKAKEDFEKWLLSDLDYVLIDECLSLDRYNLFYHLTPSMQYGVIVDWFDSVGIFIQDEYNEVGKKYQYHISFEPVQNDCFSRCIFDTRTQARQKAIEKSNEIYNNRV